MKEKQREYVNLMYQHLIKNSAVNDMGECALNGIIGLLFCSHLGHLGCVKFLLNGDGSMLSSRIQGFL